MFVEEKLLKLEYQIIAQKLAAIKVKKSIAAQQARLGDEVAKQRNASRRLMEQTKLLEECLSLGEWKSQRDEEFVTEQRAKLTQYKRKLDQDVSDQDSAELQSLRERIDEEVQNRLRDERARLDAERQRHRQQFAAESARLQDMMNAVNTTVAELNRTRKRRRTHQPQACANDAEQSNNDDGSDVIFMGVQSEDVEPD